MKVLEDGTACFYKMKKQLVWAAVLLVLVYYASIFMTADIAVEKRDGIQVGLSIFFMIIMLIFLKRYFSQVPYVRLSDAGIAIKGHDFLPWTEVRAAELRTGSAGVGIFKSKYSFYILYTRNQKPEDLTGMVDRFAGSSFYVNMNWLTSDDRQAFLEETAKYTGTPLI